MIVIIVLSSNDINISPPLPPCVCRSAVPCHCNIVYITAAATLEFTLAIKCPNKQIAPVCFVLLYEEMVNTVNPLYLAFWT